MHAHERYRQRPGLTARRRRAARSACASRRRPEYITLCRLALTGLAQLREIAEETIADLKLALTEACSNSVRHAYGPNGDGHVEITYELRPDRLAIEVVDDGEGFDPDEAPSFERRRAVEGGLGIAIIRSIADEFEIESQPGERGSRLRFVEAPRSRRQPTAVLASPRACSSSSTSATSRSRTTRRSRPAGSMDEIRALAEPLAGTRVLELSATAFGGGVAEIQYTLVPLMQDAGLDVEWRIIRGADEFFAVTKTIHNALQGNPQGLTDEQRDVLRALPGAERARDRRGRVRLRRRPRPAAGRRHRPPRRRVARSGSGAATSTSRRRTTRCSTSCCRRSGATTPRSSTSPSTCRDATGLPPCVIWPPAIDPLAPKNMALSPEDAAYIVDQFGIDVDAAAADAGVALRPVEGPARRDRRVPPREGGAPGRAARARRLDGARRSRRAGTTGTRRSPTPTATRTSSSSRTSTTSARSRSTRSRCTRRR